jgi:hypothetical protein
MLGNNGEISDTQRREFLCYMTGYARGGRNLLTEELRAEGMRYVTEEREDFLHKAFGEVVGMVNSAVSDLTAHKR